MNNFKFKLRDMVVIETSSELGEVLGRAEYSHCENNYYIRYLSADGRAVEGWWGESALTPAKL